MVMSGGILDNCLHCDLLTHDKWVKNKARINRDAFCCEGETEELKGIGNQFSLMFPDIQGSRIYIFTEWRLGLELCI